MATTSPARIDDELYASAKLAGSVQSRSASQQVAHWARIGREIEASSSISPKEIAAVLAGSRSYDSLDPKEQAVVRAEWSVRMDAARAELDLAKDFARAGRTWVELDDKGRVVERGGRAETRAPKKPAGKKPAAAKKSPSGVKANTGKTKARAAG
jgi:ParD-like antitoxin of type II ParDE toxin-antitoxin system